MNFDDLYKVYGLDIPWWHTWYDPEVAAFLHTYGSIIGNMILDVGCGYSRLADFCILHKKKYLWLDIAKSPIDYNKKYFQSTFVEFINGSIQDFSSEQQFSCIIDIWCLHCIPSGDHAFILSRYFEMLLPGWYIFLRYFSSSIESPLFHIDTVPIVGVMDKAIDNFIHLYDLSILHSEIDTVSFDLAARKSILLQKNIYAKSSPL